jgi:2-haloacid dehalogenase
MSAADDADAGVMLRYTTLLFDLDHTLLDSDASHEAAFAAAMCTLGVEAPAGSAEHFERINQALWRRVERGELSPNDVKVRRFAQLLDELGLDGDAEVMGAAFASGLADHGDLYPGAREVLDHVAGRARLALVTNGIGSVQRGRIERLGLADYFAAVVISGEVGTSKPGTAIFDLTFEQLAVERAGSVMIGDNLGSDVLGGRNAGIDTVWFNPRGTQIGTATETEIGADAEVGPIPTHVITSLDELRALV